MLTTLIPPATEPVSLAEAKLALRVDHAAEDDFISGLLRAARETVEALCGLALITRRVRETRDCWSLDEIGAQKLAVRPISAIQAVRVSGVALDPATYAADAERLAFKSLPPAPSEAFAGIEIEFDAGFGAASESVPQALRQAILILTGAYYEARAGDARIPEAARALIAAYAPVRL